MLPPIIVAKMHPMRDTFSMNTHNEPAIHEQILQKGAESLSDTELLAVLLRTGVKHKPVLKLAEEVLAYIDTRKPVSLALSLQAVNGINTAKLSVISAAFELGRRYFGSGAQKIKHPSDIVPFLRHYAIRKQEQFICTSLNGAHEIIAVRVVSVGTLTCTIVHPREVFADPIHDRAAAVIFAHNHPSGLLEPSLEDTALTKRLCQSAKLLGITVLDHIILAPSGAYLSFIEEGLPLH